MSGSAVVLVYHAVEAGPPPLCIEPSLFRRHLETIDEAGVRAVGIDQLAAELAAGGPTGPTVAITFDDGAASVVDNAAPLLAERRFPAAIFCVAAYLGARSDWPSAPARMPSLQLAGAPALGELAANGFEIGSHGMTHSPLAIAPPSELRREVVDSRSALEDAIGVAVRWFAYPYGSVPRGGGRALVERTYAGAAAGRNRPASAGADRWELPRIDAHYVRRPALLARVLLGGAQYLALRRVGGRVRRIVYRDYVSA